MKRAFWVALAVLAFPVGRSLAVEQKKPEHEVRFMALEEAEKRGKVLQVRERMLFELNARDERVKKMQSLEAAFGLVDTLDGGDAKIRKYIELRRRILELLDEIRDAGERQVEIAGLLDTAVAAGGLLPQVADYLKEVRSQLHNIGLQQDSTQKRLEKTLASLKQAILNVPAPEEFVSTSGLEMQLISAGKKSFYVSRKPLHEAGDVTLEEAVKEVRTMSEQEGAVYRLPDFLELRLMAKANVVPATAVWSSTVWEDKNDENQRMAERFGVRSYLVWDSAEHLGRGKLFGELPFAKYPELNFYVVTPAKSGWQKRWNQILADMAQQEEDKP